MASDGLTEKAKTGTCRVCQRRRNTDRHLKIVGEVRHGFAVGHIWECVDVLDCDQVAKMKLTESFSGVGRQKILNALQVGRFKEYVIVN